MPDEVEVAVVGGGPAGHTAALYASRAGRRVALILGGQPGGQLTTTSDVENWPGDRRVDGADLMVRMTEQVEELGVPLVWDEVTACRSEPDGRHRLTLAAEDEMTARAVILATGARARWLGVEGEEAYKNHGISGCAVCDGFFFRGRDVIVVGGGNSAVEEAIYLSEMCRTVRVVHRRHRFRAEGILCDRLAARPNVEVIWNSVVRRFVGDDTLREVELSGADGAARHLPIDGAFVAIGHDPATAVFADWVERDAEGYVVVEPGGTRTSRSGVFAAGDVMDKVYRQAVTSANTGCMAALDADRYLKKAVADVPRRTGGEASPETPDPAGPGKRKPSSPPCRTPDRIEQAAKAAGRMPGGRRISAAAIDGGRARRRHPPS